MGAIYLASEQPRLPGPSGVPGFDKLAHFCAYGLMATLWVRALAVSLRPRTAACLAWLVASAFGVTDEFHQSFVPGRSAELADWVADTVDKGHALDDPRSDLRDMWVRAFEAYARTCYEACAEVVTLYEDNQRVQRVLGAAPDRLRVIANGIDIARFAGLPRAADDARPTIALVRPDRHRARV